MDLLILCFNKTNPDISFLIIFSALVSCLAMTGVSCDDFSTVVVSLAPAVSVTKVVADVVAPSVDSVVIFSSVTVTGSVVVVSVLSVPVGVVVVMITVVAVAVCSRVVISVDSGDDFSMTGDAVAGLSGTTFLDIV